jgi:hypothetical protein
MQKTTRLPLLYELIENPGSECIIWPGKPHHDGYGVIWVHGKKYAAHRLALMAVTGPPQPGLQAAHGPCHNRRCINPLHLSWKTYRENQSDRIRDDTLRKKLTNADVDQIREAFSSGASTQGELARRFGVTPSMISKIISRRSWAHRA